jgi:hypothetical protein
MTVGAQLTITDLRQAARYRVDHKAIGEHRLLGDVQLHRCCQSNRNLSPPGRALPFPGKLQAMRFCHSAKAAERRVL